MDKNFNLNLSFNNSIRLKYKVEKNKKIKIFGNLFVMNNRNICKMVINNEELYLDEFFIFENTDEVILEVILTNIQKITNIEHMFNQCDSLISISGLEYLNTSNIVNMSYIFYDCKSLLSLPDISKWDTSKVVDMSYMFSECKSLLTLPDLSKWDTTNVTNMSCIFYECESLLTLPDISKWNTSNVLYMNCMFYNCKSLLFLPEISKWNTSKVIQMLGMFDHCKSISIFPEIGKWDTSSVTNMKCMFRNCESLCRIPDISHWNTSNVLSMMDMFSNCTSLICGEEILKIRIDNLSADFFDNNCINFQKNFFDKHINKLYEKMVDECELGRDLVELIYDEIDNDYYISSFISKFDMVKVIIKYNGDKNKLENWLEKYF